MSFIPWSDAADAGLDRLVRWAVQPVLARQALSVLRGPDRQLRCAVSWQRGPGAGSGWRFGRARLAEGRFFFEYGHGIDPLDLEVEGVIPTRHRGPAPDDDAMPRPLRVCRLRLADNSLYLAAHAALLAEAEVILTGPRFVEARPQRSPLRWRSAR